MSPYRGLWGYTFSEAGSSRPRNPWDSKLKSFSIFHPSVIVGSFFFFFFNWKKPLRRESGIALYTACCLEQISFCIYETLETGSFSGLQKSHQENLRSPWLYHKLSSLSLSFPLHWIQHWFMSSEGLLSSTSHHQRCKPQGSAPVTPWLLMKLLPLSLSLFPSRGWESPPKGGYCQIYSSQLEASQVLGISALLSLLRGVWSATVFTSCRNLEPVTDILQVWGSVRQCTLRCQHSLDLPPRSHRSLNFSIFPFTLSWDNQVIHLYIE